MLLFFPLLAAVSASCVAPDGFDLSPLSNQGGDYSVSDSHSPYIYNFNICRSTHNQCNFEANSTVCQTYGINNEVSCGSLNQQDISYLPNLNAYQFNYRGGDHERDSSIVVTCDPTQTGGIFQWAVTSAPPSLHYLITGVSALACNPAHNPTPSPSAAPAGNFTFHVRTDSAGAQSWFLANNASPVLVQNGAQGPYTFPAIAKLIYSFAGIIHSGAYTWFSAADGTQYIVPTTSGAADAGGNGALASSAFPVPPASFKAYAAMIVSGVQLAAQNSIVIDGPSMRPMPQVHSRKLANQQE